MDDATLEPPVPPGLALLDDAHETLASFLEIDPDLLAVAAAASAPATPQRSTAKTAPAWLATLSPQEKDQWLLRFLTAEDGAPEAEFRRRFLRSQPALSLKNEVPPRTAGSLLKAMERAAELRRAAVARERSAALLAKQQKAAAARRAHLESLKGREGYLWKSIASLTASTSPTSYASAVAQLTDLRDLAQLTGKTGDFNLRFIELAERHRRQTALLGRFKAPG